MRYMDDGRAFLHPVKRGWRSTGDKLEYCKKWEIEDAGKSQLEVTVEVVKESMRGVTDYLKFTYETGEDYDGGWLPTLDTSLKVSPHNQTKYKYRVSQRTVNT